MLGKKEMDDFEKSGDLNTIIGKGSAIEGNIKVQNSMRVDGRVKGQIMASDSIVVGKEGDIEGELRVKNIIIGGRVKGKIFASGKVVLEARSVFQGELKTSKLVIDDGAVFDGTCSMTEGGKILALPEAADGRQPSNAEQRSPQREAVVNR
ncbi:MAG: polymer-forming cytoskeletal protein [candidate division KSB1 bacterium]